MVHSDKVFCQSELKPIPDSFILIICLSPEGTYIEYLDDSEIPLRAGLNISKSIKQRSHKTEGKSVAHHFTCRGNPTSCVKCKFDQNVIGILSARDRVVLF